MVDWIPNTAIHRNASNVADVSAHKLARPTQAPGHSRASGLRACQPGATAVFEIMRKAVASSRLPITVNQNMV